MEGHKLNNFREWLSDNLRYFILGFFVILVLVVAFVIIRFASSRLGDDKSNNQTTQTIDSEVPKAQQDNTSESEVQAVPTQIVNNNALERNAHPQVNEVIQKYYQALSAKDVEGIRAVVDELDSTEANKITSDQYIDGYSDIEVYTKDGAQDGEYVVLARYYYTFKDIDTKVPGLSMMYVRPREDGNLHITMKEQDTQAREQIAKTREETDVQELIESVENDYARAQEDDETLRDFISSFGIASSQASKAEDGSTITIKYDCNVRDSADVSGEVVTQLSTGDKVTKLGNEGEWIKISFDDTEGYVRSDLFE